METDLQKIGWHEPHARFTEVRTTSGTGNKSFPGGSCLLSQHMKMCADWHDTRVTLSKWHIRMRTALQRLVLREFVSVFNRTH
jgi:hypothetical protein